MSQTLPSSPHVAIVGATGAVGVELLDCLTRRDFPLASLRLLASPRSAGRTMAYRGQELPVEVLTPESFAGVDIALFSAGGSISRDFASAAVQAGAVVVDNSSAFRMNPDVPLVIPEVNPGDALRHQGIVANPNCSTIQMVMALKPLHDRFGVKRVVVATYQSVSGAGKEGMDELWAQSRAMYVNDPVTAQQFTKPIAFNCIPHIDTFMEDGSTKEEWKMAVETRKILGGEILVHATCVRVPVFIGHAEAVTVEFERPLTAGDARNLLRDAPGVTVMDTREDGGYMTPADCAGEDAVYVSRVRKDPTVPNGLSFWCVSDNLRKGAALNAVQIAETLVAQGLMRRAA